MASKSEKAVALLSEIDESTFEGDEASRVNVIIEAQKLLSRLQSPTERCYDLMSVTLIWGTLKTFQDLGIWEAWANDGGEKTLQGLAALANTDIDINLLRHLVRFLTSAQMIDEVGEERYKPNKFSFFMGKAGALIPQGWADHWRNIDVAGFLKATLYKEPMDPLNTAYSYGTPEKLSFWARMASNPAYQESWAVWMATWTDGKVPWTSYFDTKALLDGADLSGPILVDVGGNKGNDLNRFLEKYPDIPEGSLILQDLPPALEFATVGDKIKTMPYDYYTPQPVIGSRAYFFHAIFHDQNYEQALEILKNLKPAMKKGYSKLLICDVTIPPTGATYTQANMDMIVMLVVAAYERTQGQWEDLLTGAGFKIIKLWPDPRGFETLIEAELA